jgi:hypothetical protein
MLACNSIGYVMPSPCMGWIVRALVQVEPLAGGDECAVLGILIASRSSSIAMEVVRSRDPAIGQGQSALSALH